MTDAVIERSGEAKSLSRAQRLRRRYAAERRFRLYGIVAIAVALLGLAALVVSIVAKGYTAFTTYEVALEIAFDPAYLDPAGTGDPKVLGAGDYRRLVREALVRRFPEARDRRARRDLVALVSTGAAFELRDMVLADPTLVGRTRTVSLPLSDDAALLLKGKIPRSVPETDRPISDRQIGWLDRLVEEGAIVERFNTRFFTEADSREPELAGIWGAVVGSFYTMVVTLVLSFPFGIAAAVYLEEFAPRNRWTDLIEVNINNLAAVPSIVFGLLGLAVFLGFFQLPRSSPIVGGMVLSLLTLPTVIIAGRAALKSVPPSIRAAALALGASPMQVAMHHTLPLALPGILTGTIIGMARALGETAPLLMIGMVAFIADVPSGPGDPATALPVQVYLWADSPERGFVEKTAAATLVLLVFLVLMNALAVYLRKRFERRW